MPYVPIGRVIRDRTSPQSVRAVGLMRFLVRQERAILMHIQVTCRVERAVILMAEPKHVRIRTDVRMGVVGVAGRQFHFLWETLIPQIARL